MKPLLASLIILGLVVPAHANPNAEAALLLKAPASAGASDITNGLILQYKFNGDLTDASGNNNFANGSATMTYVTGQDGNASHAVSFNGTTQYCVSTNNVSLGSVFTIACWVQASGTQNAYARICETYYLDSLFLGASSGGTKFNAIIKNNAGGGLDLCESAAFVANTWYHLSVTYDGTTTALYTNGVLAASITRATGATTDHQAFVAEINPASVTSSKWKGLLDDLRIYNRALSSAELTTLYTNGAH